MLIKMAKRKLSDIVEIIKAIEQRKQEAWKLPKHQRNKFFYYRLPYVYNRYRNHNFVFSLKNLLEKACQRYRKVFGTRIDFDSKVIGKGKDHAMSVRIKIYFKQ